MLVRGSVLRADRVPAEVIDNLSPIIIYRDALASPKGLLHRKFVRRRQRAIYLPTDCS